MGSVIHSATWLAAAVAVFAACRWAFKISPLLGRLLTAGIIARILFGAGLFACSYYRWPVFQHLQAGDGFWALAIDARWYYDHAAEAALNGFAVIEETAPSPQYLRIMAAFMRLAGVTPLAAVLFNLLCYVVVAVVIVAACRTFPRLATVSLAAFTVSPGSLIFGSQVLKDPLTVALIALGCGAVRLLTGGLCRAHVSPGRIAAGSLLLGAVIFVLGGIRPYLSVFTILGVAVAGAATLVLREVQPHRWRVAAVYVVLLAALWGTFAKGAGVYYPFYANLFTGMFANPGSAGDQLAQQRTGFAASGGATSLAEPPSGGDAVRATPSGPVRRTLTGLAALFVPVLLLRAASIVSFEGGRGLLLITDLDTLVMDISIGACLYVFFSSRPRGPSLAIAAGMFAIALLACVTMAYVVTNFGTMFRLRLFAVAPLWLLPALAWSPATAMMPAPSAATSRVP
jgi:hypothetical protein